MGIRVAKDMAGPVPPPARSLEELLAASMGGQPPPVQPTQAMIDSVGQPVSPVNMGGNTAGMSRLGVLLQQRKALQDAPLGSRVNRTPTGWDYDPPEQSPNRWKKALGTGLQGVALAQPQNPWQALGAFGAGFGAGAVSPKLADQFTRHLDTEENARAVGQEAGIDLTTGRIADLMAQADYNQARPGIELTRIMQQQQEAADRIAAQDRATAQRGSAATLADERGREANRLRGEANEIRRNQPGRAKPTRTIDGVLWEQSDGGDWVRARGGPTQTASSRQEGKDRERDADASREAQALYNKASDYWQQAQDKRAEAARLGGSVTTRAANKDAIDRLIREAEGLETKTRTLQVDGDKLDAKSKTAGSSQAGGGVTEQQVRDAARQKGLDPNTAVQRARDKGILPKN